MPVTAGPIYPGVKNGLVFAIDPKNPDSWTGPTSNIVNNLVSFNSNLSGSIYNDTSGSYGEFNSFVFDGVDDYISLNDISLSGEFTLSWWMKRTNYSGNNHYFFGEDNAANSDWIRFNSGLLDVRTGNPGNNYQLTDQGTAPSFTFTNNNIYNITKTRDSDFLIQAYSNAAVDGSYTPLRLPKASATPRAFSPNTFGRKNATHLSATIGPILINNRALSATEVTQNYNRLKGRFGLT